jgi:hypothetical protein
LLQEVRKEEQTEQMIGRVNDLLDIFTALVEHLDRQEGQRENREDQDDKVPDTKLLFFSHDK